jgi:hypothetical protein
MLISAQIPGLAVRMSHLFAPNKRNIEFHELFKNIPQDELLIDSKFLIKIEHRIHLFRLFLRVKP